MKQLQYDLSVYQAWQRNCASVYGAREHAKQERKLNRKLAAVDAAAVFLKTCTRLTLWDPQRPEATVGEILDFRQDHIVSKLGVLPSAIPSLVVLNWAAPSLVPNPIQDSQISVLFLGAER